MKKLLLFILFLAHTVCTVQRMSDMKSKSVVVTYYWTDDKTECGGYLQQPGKQFVVWIKTDAGIVQGVADTEQDAKDRLSEACPI